MKKLTATLCLTLCTCLFATSAVAKTVHLGCFGLKSTIEHAFIDISINFTKKTATLTETVFNLSFTTDAFITGKTITFKYSEKDQFHINKFLWRLDRESLLLHLKFDTEITDKGNVIDTRSSKHTYKCDIHKKGKNKI